MHSINVDKRTVILKATISPSLGYCVIQGSNGEPELLSAIRMEQLDPRRERQVLTLVHDWQILEAEDSQAALLETKRLSMAAKCVSLVRLSLMVPKEELGNWLFEEIESIISNYVSSKFRIQQLLIAPYANTNSIKQCAEAALSNGYAVVGELLNRLYNFQPLILRFSTIWLRLPHRPFFSINLTRQDWWVRLIESGNMLEIIEASDKQTINRIFGRLAFDSNVPSERSAIAALGHAISDQLFGGPVGKEKLAAVIYEDDAPARLSHDEFTHKHWKAELNRALTEIDAISNALANGDDYHAERFLYDLINRQTADDSMKDHAVKSLCNIAKQCFDMFRTDFEYICLRKAREIDSTDAWTMVQLGDHYKRRGQYKEAKEIVNAAIGYDIGWIGESLLADIRSQEGNYEEAIELYKKIDGWEKNDSIRMAIADNYRRLGRFEEASEEYEKLEIIGLASDRTIAGRAEIAKREGRLDEAINLYSSLIDNFSVSDSAWWVYSVAYAGLLKQAGKYDDALVVVEDVIARVPFFMQARVLRSSICGLKGDAEGGLSGLPSADTTYSYTAYGEWVSEYTRGLLLLRTHRYKDAQDRLLASLEKSVLGSEERTILRLAAALALLADERNIEAKKLIISIDDIRNSHVKYLARVLEYHISILEKDVKKSQILYENLESNKDLVLWEAVKALREGKVDQAARIEIDAMLSIAA